MTARNNTNELHNGRRFRASTLNRVLEAMRGSSGATLYEIADKADTSVQYVRQIITHVDEVKTYIDNGNIAPSDTGPLPKWAKDADGNELPLTRVPSKALVIPNDDFAKLPTKLRDELKSEVIDTTALVAAAIRRTPLSPKSQRAKVSAIRQRMLHTAEREEKNMLYIEDSAKRQAADERRIATLERLIATIDKANGKVKEVIPA